MRGLKTLIDLRQKKSLDAKIGVAQVMLKLNMHDFPMLVKKMNVLGVDYIYSQSLDLIGQGKNIARELPSPPDYLEVIIDTIQLLKTITNPNLTEISIYLPHPYYPFLAPVFKYNKFIINDKIILNIDIKNCNCKQYNDMLEIEPDGNINGCYAKVNMKETSIGNISNYLQKPEELIEVIRAGRERYLKIIESDQFECKTCKYYDVCKGGCRANALSYFGSLYKKDPRCPGENYTIPERLRNKIYSVLDNIQPIQTKKEVLKNEL